MATELPFYKFEVMPYFTGDICLERWELRGIFFDICAFYWSKNCELSLISLRKKYDGHLYLVEELINLDILKVDGEFLSINFLNEQWASKETQKIVNTINGKKGGRPKKENPNETEKKPNGFNFANPNETNKDKIIIDNNREDDIRKESSVFSELKSDLIDALVLHFGFSEMKFDNNKRVIFQFVNSQMLNENDIGHFKNQFANYQEYKKASKETIHNFTGYIGTPAMQFQNSAWNSENWEEKLSKFKSNPNNLTKFERAKASYDGAQNPYTQKQ